MVSLTLTFLWLCNYEEKWEGQCTQHLCLCGGVFTLSVWSIIYDFGGFEKLKWKWSCSVVSNSSQPHGQYPTTLLCPWDFPGKSTGVGYHILLQRVFLIQGLNPGLLHCRQMLYHPSHQGRELQILLPHGKRWKCYSSWLSSIST